MKGKREYDQTDQGFGTLHVCGFESVSYARDQAGARHDAECCDCALMRAWWRERIKRANVEMRRESRQMVMFV